MTLAGDLRALKPRVVILPYWGGRATRTTTVPAEIAYEACFLAGLKKLDAYSEAHRPFKVIYSSLYANVTPSFVVDISTQFERRMEALLSYRSQYGEVEQGREPVSQGAGDPRAPRCDCALLWQSHRRALRRTFRR